MLVDAQGKITYDVEGMDEDELRKEIAKPGPEYAPLLPKPKQTPCVACTDYVVLPTDTPVSPPMSETTDFGCRWVRKTTFLSLLEGLATPK
jgi:hypothetical protein